jgi:hypothetical protein
MKYAAEMCVGTKICILIFLKIVPGSETFMRSDLYSVVTSSVKVSNNPIMV